MNARLPIALCLLLCVACGGDDPNTPAPQRPRVTIDVDRSACSSGCSGPVEFELIVLTPTLPLPCIIDSQQGPAASDTVFAGLDLKSGDELGVGVKLRCANDSCVRCWARDTVTVSDGASMTLELKPMALSCTFYGDVVFDNPVVRTCGN